MPAKILNFKTDFTMFLQEKTRQTIKVVTDSEVIECSSVILSQHSQTLKKMIEEDEELYLLGYQSIWDILTILYGGSVVLSLDNCLEMIKFGWEFGVPNIADQAFNFMESIANKSNIVPIARLCLTAMKLTRFYDVKTEQDVFWPCEGVLANLDPLEVADFVKSFQPEEIVQMFGNKRIMAQVINPLSGQITEDNVPEIIGVLQGIDSADLVAAASRCSQEDASLFFRAIEEHDISLCSATSLLNLKKLIFHEIGSSTVIFLTSKPDISSILKHWKTYDVDQMMWTCVQVLPSFWLMETLLSWVSFFSPRNRVVKRLCRFLNSSSIYMDYARHIISTLVNLGYDISFDADLDRICRFQVSKRHQVMAVSEVKTKVIKDIDSNVLSVSEKQVIFNCDYFAHEYKCKEGSIIDISLAKNYIPEITCPVKNIVNGSLQTEKLESLYVYAKTVDGKHVPFYTDPKLAANMEYDLSSIKLTDLMVPIPPQGPSFIFTPGPKRARKS